MGKRLANSIVFAKLCNFSHAKFSTYGRYSYIHTIGYGPESCRLVLAAVECSEMSPSKCLLVALSKSVQIIEWI